MEDLLAQPAPIWKDLQARCCILNLHVAPYWQTRHI